MMTKPKRTKPLPADRDLLIRLLTQAECSKVRVELLQNEIERRLLVEQSLGDELEARGMPELADEHDRGVMDDGFVTLQRQQLDELRLARRLFAPYLDESPAELLNEWNSVVQIMNETADNFAAYRSTLRNLEDVLWRLLDHDREQLGKLCDEIGQRLDPRGSDAARRKARNQRVRELWEMHRQTNRWTHFSQEVLLIDPILRDLGVEVSADDARNICRPRGRRKPR